MRPLAPVLLLSACNVGVLTTPVDEPAGPTTIPGLWAGEVPSSTRVTIGEAIVTSPLAAGETTFYVQHPGGGLQSGLQVVLADSIPDWPPPVGTPIQLTGTQIQFAGGPTLWLDDRDDLRILGDPVPPVATPWSDDPDLIWALVEASDVTITSSVDPSGIATTSLGQRLRPDFAVPTPGWNRVGDLTAINGLALSLLLRTSEDWTGDLQGDPAVVATLEDLPGMADGTPVILEGMVQATPWSRGERYALLQNDSGTGFWIDAEGFGAPPTTEGDRGTWTGQLRFGGDGMRVRVWDDPTIELVGQPILTFTGEPDDAPQGAIVQDTVAELLAIGARGDRLCDDWLLDNRFQLLGSMSDPDEVVGVVRIDAQQTRRLAVLDFL